MSVSVKTRATQDWYHNVAAKAGDIDDAIDEIGQLPGRDFESLWVAIVLEQATEEPLQINQLARLLNAARVRYRGFRKCINFNTQLVLCSQCGINLKRRHARECKACQLQLARQRARPICTNCGKGLKFRYDQTAQKCLDCYNEERRLQKLARCVCPLCGGSKKARSQHCARCAIKVRSVNRLDAARVALRQGAVE